MEQDREIAERFAPIFFQGIAGRGRFDYITNFDFDGDWVGDNNWVHSADKQYPLKAYIYYSVSETPTHYFIHYAVFHPRDWKGGEKTGRVLSGTIREGTTIGGHLKPRGLVGDIVLAHENDLEGCLVVVAKHGTDLSAAQVVLVDTVAHNRYLTFTPETRPNTRPLRVEGQRALLYIEPKGHGIEAFADQRLNTDVTEADGAARPEGSDGVARGTVKEPNKIGGLLKKMKNVVTLKVGEDEADLPDRIRIYTFTGTAEDPEIKTGPVGFDLKPLLDTFWKTASAGRNDTYAETVDYGTRMIYAIASIKDAVVSQTMKLGVLGSALRGVAGAPNKARPPWGWFDMGERDRPLGEWFFDPANTLVRRAGQTRDWATAYLHHPIFHVLRGQPAAPAAPASSHAAKISS